MLAKNVVALKAYTIATKGIAIATKVWTAVQAAFNIVMAMNPIVLIVLGIMALIAAIVLLVVHWDTVKKAMISAWEWIKKTFASVSQFVPILGVFSKIKDIWTSIKSAFVDGGIIEGIKQIGRSLLALVLEPIIAIMRLLNEVGLFKGVTANLVNFQNGLISGGKEPTQAENPQANTTRSMVTRNETRTDKLTMEIVDKNNAAKVTQLPSFVPVNVTKTGF
jgi:hypothetical protein